MEQRRVRRVCAIYDRRNQKQSEGNERQEDDGTVFASDAWDCTYPVPPISSGIRGVQRELTSMLAIRSNTAQASIEDASERRIQSYDLWLVL